MTATVIKQAATGHVDLLDKLHTFLTTDVTLVGAGEQWVEMERTTVVGVSDEMILKGTGMAGTDEIYIGLRTVDDVGTDAFNIELRGFGGYNAGAIWDEQPLATPKSTYLCSYNQPLEYWFVANGRRFIIVQHVDTSYVSSYCGLFLPYASPTEYPYPLYVAGSTGRPEKRFSDNDGVGHAGSPMAASTGGAASSFSDVYINTNTGYLLVQTRTNTGTDSTLSDVITYPFADSGNRVAVRDDIDGGYSVQDTVIINNAHGSVSGILEGYAWISGVQNTAESVVVIDSVSWLVLPDVSRVQIEDFYAVRLL